jgi:ABC-type antimicrobial peptide transport system permease subunit
MSLRVTLRTLLRSPGYAGVTIGTIALTIALAAAMNVGGRLREIGIRSAVGAHPRALVRMIVAQHLRATAIGVAVGLLASWWTTRSISRVLFKVDAHDARLWVIAAAALLVAAGVAAWIPARRAGRVSPMMVLKAE